MQTHKRDRQPLKSVKYRIDLVRLGIVPAADLVEKLLMPVHKVPSVAKTVGVKPTSAPFEIKIAERAPHHIAALAQAVAAKLVSWHISKAHIKVSRNLNCTEAAQSMISTVLMIKDSNGRASFDCSVLAAKTDLTIRPRNRASKAASQRTGGSNYTCGSRTIAIDGAQLTVAARRNALPEPRP